jgi:hypothetical protein
MSKPVRIEVTRLVAAPSSHVFSILSDYRVGHPRILPRGLKNLIVEQGGRGAGTIIRFEVRSFGTVRAVRASVDEPDPGRVLVERSLDGNAFETRFTVDPAYGGGSWVTIETSWTPRGPRALLERLVGPFLLHRAHAEELDNLATVAKGGLPTHDTP